MKKLSIHMACILLIISFMPPLFADMLQCPNIQSNTISSDFDRWTIQLQLQLTGYLECPSVDMTCVSTYYTSRYSYNRLQNTISGIDGEKTLTNIFLTLTATNITNNPQDKQILLTCAGTYTLTTAAEKGPLSWLLGRWDDTPEQKYQGSVTATRRISHEEYNSCSSFDNTSFSCIK